jgi:hypothetical protein
MVNRQGVFEGGGRAGFFGPEADTAAAETVARHLVQAQALATAEETLGPRWPGVSR